MRKLDRLGLVSSAVARHTLTTYRAYGASMSLKECRYRQHKVNDEARRSIICQRAPGRDEEDADGYLSTARSRGFPRRDMARVTHLW